MSSGLHAELQALSKRADSLQVAAVDLAESVAYLLRPGAFGDWTLVDDSFHRCPSRSSEPFWPFSAFTALRTASLVSLRSVSDWPQGA